MNDFNNQKGKKNKVLIIPLILFSCILIIPICQLVRVIALSLPISMVGPLIIKYIIEIIIVVLGIVLSIIKLKQSSKVDKTRGDF